MLDLKFVDFPNRVTLILLVLQHQTQVLLDLVIHFVFLIDLDDFKKRAFFLLDAEHFEPAGHRAGLLVEGDEAVDERGDRVVLTHLLL